KQEKKTALSGKRYSQQQSRRNIDLPTILLIDPDERAIEFLSSGLSFEGYRVKACQSPQQIREIVAKVQPHLILLGLDFPDFDGLALCQQLREDAATKDLPIIVSSASNEPVWPEASQSGASAFLAKP